MEAVSRDFKREPAERRSTLRSRAVEPFAASEIVEKQEKSGNRIALWRRPANAGCIDLSLAGESPANCGLSRRHTDVPPFSIP
jgi:hypothetical protein